MTKRTRKTAKPEAAIMGEAERLALFAATTIETNAMIEANGPEVDEGGNDINAEDYEAPVRKSKVHKNYQLDYAKRALKHTCSDSLAYQLAEIAKPGTGQKEALRALGDLNTIDVETRWGHLNIGMQRMNLSNVLRHRAKKGEEVRLAA